jgi:putative flippase GtrA
MLRWIRFNAVGVFGFILQSVTLFLLTHTTLQLGYFAATAAAVEIAVLNNFYRHQRWTWKDRPSSTAGDTLARLLKFNLTNGLVSLAGNVLIIGILVRHAGLPIVGANCVSVAVCSIFNFILADRVAFQIES